MANAKQTLRLFCDFFKFGCFTFGGGWSIIAQMRKKYVEDQGILTNEELLDITSVGRSLPGTMIGNVALLFGYRCGGALCGIACLIGMILPPMAVLCVVTMCYNAIKDNLYVARAMMGVRAAVAPIIGAAALSLWKSAYKYPLCYGIMAGALALYLFAGVSCVLLVLIGGAAGIAVSEYYERKEAKLHGAS